MSYVVLQPNSESNPSAVYRVVDFDEWTAYMDGRTSSLNVRDEALTFEEAEAKRNRMNGRL